MEEFYQRLQFMEERSKSFICYICLLLVGILGTGCRKNAPIASLSNEYIVDIYNYFGKSLCTSDFDKITFTNGIDSFSLDINAIGDFVCPNLDGRIVLYYPTSNLICMLCDTLTNDAQLQVYIDGSRYFVTPKKEYAIYSIDDFFRNFIYVNLLPGDSLFNDKTSIVVQREEFYEIIDIKGDFMDIRVVQYDEESIPRFISQPSAKILRYRWRNGDILNTSRLVIDE